MDLASIPSLAVLRSAPCVPAAIESSDALPATPEGRIVIGDGVAEGWDIAELMANYGAFETLDQVDGEYAEIGAAIDGMHRRARSVIDQFGGGFAMYLRCIRIHRAAQRQELALRLIALMASRLEATDEGGFANWMLMARPETAERARWLSQWNRRRHANPVTEAVLAEAEARDVSDSQRLAAYYGRVGFRPVDKAQQTSICPILWAWGTDIMDSVGATCAVQEVPAGEGGLDLQRAEAS